jgi:hypothetical protein
VTTTLAKHGTRASAASAAKWKQEADEPPGQR